jgi:AraC family transcriptional regulator
MDEKVHYLYGQWLPSSGEELRDFPCFFHYINLFPEVPEHELITDIYLPLISVEANVKICETSKLSNRVNFG